MLKLRTMRTDAEQVKAALAGANEVEGGVLFKMRRDPRVTRVGQVLRRFSLDELPQLFNVLRGDMALIGPRPALPDEVARYDARAARRLQVKPGLTGLWQVSGRSDLSWDEAIRLDLEYVEDWSLTMDLTILLRTAGAVLGRRGAY
ncbi:sugar transferase [Nocardioides sp. TF02-7]|uniref:sugar transferase n=1 Tax=Nocardioides sp. TF02-7 TaxID=2917724 RepID=UPI001F0686EF|nr:sugar transferase [Nocardioides sp. TF02-7]UMG91353.1 sugar transferase [Nocardioides sp. TF02-7]